MTRRHYLLLPLLSSVAMACGGAQQPSQGQSITHPQHDTTTRPVAATDTTSPVAPQEPLYCIGYPEAEAWEHEYDPYPIDFREYVRSADPYRQGQRALTDGEVRRWLPGPDSTVAITNIWTDEVVETQPIASFLEQHSCFLNDTPAVTARWTALLIEQIEADGSQIFLVTVDKNDRLLSKQRIAFYIRAGTYTGADGARYPWFALQTACIDRHHVIRTDDHQGRQHIYAIDDAGHIRQRP